MSGVSGFSDADRSPDPARLVASLDLSAQHLAGISKRLWELAGLASATRWLDLGCGVGHAIAGHDAAIGLDRSVVLMSEGRARWPDLRVAAGDAHNLPFVDESFDGCRIERVLQHVADPARALAEVGRVLQPGARVAMWEPDWASLTFDTDDTELDDAFARAAAEGTASGRVGRQLVRLVMDAGFSDVGGEPLMGTVKDVAGLRAMVGVQRAVDRLVAQRYELRRVDAWLASLAELEQRGALRIYFNRYFAWGTKP